MMAATGTTSPRTSTLTPTTTLTSAAAEILVESDKQQAMVYARASGDNETATINDAAPAAADLELLVRPPPKLKANASHLLASNDLISPPQSTLASLASTPRGSETLSLDLSLDPPPIPMLRTRGETVTSDTQQRELLHRQSTASVIADRGVYHGSDVGNHLQLDGPVWTLEHCLDGSIAEKQLLEQGVDVATVAHPNRAASGSAVDNLVDATRTIFCSDTATRHQHHDTSSPVDCHHPLLTPAPSYSFVSTSSDCVDDGIQRPRADHVAVTLATLPPPPPPPASRSTISSPHVPISPAASVHLNTAFAFDPASTLLASAIPLPESPAIDSAGRPCSSDSVFARAFGFESNADPAFVPTPELVPNSNPAATSVAAEAAPSPPPTPIPISASAFPSAISSSSSADYHSSCASTVRLAEPVAMHSCLDQTPVQSLTPQPWRSSLHDDGVQGFIGARAVVGEEISAPGKSEDIGLSLHLLSANAPVAFPSPPSPAAIFGNSIDPSVFLNDSAFSGTFLSEPVPLFGKLASPLTPSTETLAARRNAPSLSLSSPSTPQPDTSQAIQAPTPTLVQPNAPLDSAVAVSATVSSSSSAASISDKRVQHVLGEGQRVNAGKGLPQSPSAVSIASTCSGGSRTLKRSKGCDQLSKQYSLAEHDIAVAFAPSNASMASQFEALPPLTLPTLAPLLLLGESAPNNVLPKSPPPAPPSHTGEAAPTGAIDPPSPLAAPTHRSPPRLSIPPPPPPPDSPTSSSFTSAPRRRSVPARQEMRASYAASSIYQLQAFLDSISEPAVGELSPPGFGETLALRDLGFKSHASGEAAAVSVPETRDELLELNRKIDRVADEVVELERVLMTVAEEDSDGELEMEQVAVEEGQMMADAVSGSATSHHQQSTVSARGESAAQLGKKQSLNEVIMGKKRLLRQMSQVSLQAEARLGHPSEDPVPTIRSLSSTLGANCPYPGVDESRWLAYVHQRDVVQGKKQFNVSAAHGIRYLINRAILPNPDAPVPSNQRLHHQLQCAHAIATFLTNEHGVSMTSVGRLLGQSHEFSRMVLKEYVAQLHLGPGVPLDHAVRAFLARVRLPGDQDAMDRIADEVARGWWEQNAMSTRVLPVRTQSPMMGGGGITSLGSQAPHAPQQQQPPAPPPRSRSPLHSITAALASLRNRAGSGASTLSTMTYHSTGRGGHHEPITLGLSHWWWTLPVAVALTGALFKLHVEAIAGMIKRGNRQQRKAFVAIVAKDLDRAVPGLADDPGLTNALKAVFDDAVSIPGAVSGDNEFFALYMYFQEMERALQVEYESLFASSLGEGGKIPPRSPTSPLLASSPASPVWSSHPPGQHSPAAAMIGSSDGRPTHASSPMHSLPRSSTTPEPPMLMRCMPSFASATSTSLRNSTSSSRIIRGPTRHTSLDPPMSVASMSVAGAGTGSRGHSSSYVPMSPSYAGSDLSVADSTSKRSALGRSKDSMVSAWKKMKRKLTPGQQQEHDYMEHQHRRPSQLAVNGHGHGRPVTRFPPTAEE